MTEPITYLEAARIAIDVLTRAEQDRPKLVDREAEQFAQQPLNELGNEIHDWSKRQGFYDRSYNFGEHLMLIVSEAAEALEDFRAGSMTHVTSHDINGKPIGIPSELADIIIRVLDTMTYLGINIDAVVREKINYNKTRPRMNGKLL